MEVAERGWTAESFEQRALDGSVLSESNDMCMSHTFGYGDAGRGAVLLGGLWGVGGHGGRGRVVGRRGVVRKGSSRSWLSCV